MFEKFTSEEKEDFNNIISDLKIIFNKKIIEQDEFNDVLENLKSKDVKSYLEGLKIGSKPESVLRESFFSGSSVFNKYLGSALSPEVRWGDGYVDYLLKDERGRFILIELKSLFEGEYKKLSSHQKEFVRLKQSKLDYKKHKGQILNYLQEGGEYIVLTNLKEWYFFDKTCNKSQLFTI